MKETGSTPLRIGIIGGGQLGRMLILAGRPLGFRFGVLDADPRAPASSIADKFIVGTLYDQTALEELVGWADVTTFEIEHADTTILDQLAQRGARIVPDARLLALINDKFKQKSSLAAAGVPVPEFWPEHPGEYPVVQKLRHGGYDGRGVTVLTSPADELLDGDSYFEEKVDLRAELAVLVARNGSGEITAYPVVDMTFHPGANIVTQVVIPARVPPDIRALATRLAIHAVEAIGGVGILAVELFWSQTGELVVNEIAPRPHNSGHLTIESCETSQFEQHLRAVCDLPLGLVQLRCPAVSVNLLGAPGATGVPDMKPLVSLLARERHHLHWYDKTEVRPFRKMGHLTITADDTETAVRDAERLGEVVWIEGASE